MASQKDGSDAEDIPSDFFDDFSKEEFMEGLSVIDSWSDENKPRARIDAEAVESVRDLRELIEGREEGAAGASGGERRPRERERRRSRSRSLDHYTMPGSRRDISKTNEAIKRDKAVKVKQQLAKHLEATDDLRPPGTELDDFFDDTKRIEQLMKENNVQKREDDRKRESPPRRHRRSPQRSPRRSPQRRLRRSPSPIRPGRGRGNWRHSRMSPRAPQIRHFRLWADRRSRSPRRSPHRSPRRSPRRSPHRSPRRSPHRSPRWERRSRSRDRRSRSRDRHLRKSRSVEHRDPFLYPNENRFSDDLFPRRDASFLEYPEPGPFPGGAPPGYQFTAPGVQFMPGPYGESPYGMQPVPPGDLSTMPMPALMPQPVPAPVLMPTPAMLPAQTVSLPAVPLPAAPPMVPAPQQLSHISPDLSNHNNKMEIDLLDPRDPLAQLVAEGKLSKEDYLKLAPNKSKSARLSGATSSSMDVTTRVDALSRCNIAVSKLCSIKTPNQIMMNVSLFGPEVKAIESKFCSPLKRQATVEFHFTTPSVSAAAIHNKQLIEAILGKVGMTNFVARRKKTPKNMKDAAVQTTKPYCDVCEVREATQSYDTGTSIDPEYFSTSTHTQVVEKELLSSKAMFGTAPAQPMSIAHLTPAQLVSQLAARAKTLKQTEPPPLPQPQHYRRPDYDYGYEGRGQHFQDNYNNSYGRY